MRLFFLCSFLLSWMILPGAPHPSLPAGQEQAPESVEVNASRWRGDQGEVSIAADPLDPQRVVAAAMNPDEGPLLVMASSDGGENWVRSLLPLPAGAVLHADPMVAFDSRGRVHLAVIPVGRNNVPLGIELSRSDDGGATWSEPLRISKATGRDDKLALAVDDDPQSPYRDRVHVAWKWPSGDIFYSSSSDGGLHFSRPRLVDTTRVSGLDLAPGVNGELYLAASDGGERVMRVLRSTDGGGSFLPSAAVAPVRAQWYTTQPSHCQRKSLVQASIAVDRSGGPHRGTVYLTWADYETGKTAAQCTNGCDPTAACTTEVFFCRSSDGGRNWSEPATLPAGAPAGQKRDRYFQWSRVDVDSGALYIGYKDSLRDPDRLRTDLFLSWSMDGGSSFAPALRLSSVASAVAPSSFQFGDYQGLAVSKGQVYVAWSDYRDPEDGEIYVGRVAFSSPPLADAALDLGSFLRGGSPSRLSSADQFKKSESRSFDGSILRIP